MKYPLLLYKILQKSVRSIHLNCVVWSLQWSKVVYQQKTSWNQFVFKIKACCEHVFDLFLFVYSIQTIFNSKILCEYCLAFILIWAICCTRFRSFLGKTRSFNCLSSSYSNENCSSSCRCLCCLSINFHQGSSPETL